VYPVIHVVRFDLHIAYMVYYLFRHLLGFSSDFSMLLLIPPFFALLLITLGNFYLMCHYTFSFVVYLVMLLVPAYMLKPSHSLLSMLMTMTGNMNM